MSLFHKTNAVDTSMATGVTVTLDELLRLRFSAERLQWFSSHTAQTVQTGATLSRTYGRGMEFAEVRGYQPGDDVRLINWQMTARTGKPYTKVYQEERERPVYVVVDGSTTMRFATRCAFKSVIAARIATLIAWAALAHGDQVGGMTVGDSQTQWISPRRHHKTVVQLLAAIAHGTALPTTLPVTSDTLLLTRAMMQLQQRRVQGATLCIVSDFANMDSALLTLLGSLSKHNTVTLVFVYDYFEQHAPPHGMYSVSDGSQQLSINTHDAIQEKAYTHDFQQRWEMLSLLCRTSRCHFLPVSTDADVITALNRLGVGYV